ncbi:MAG: hypothetical protein EOM67_07630 [Spirochaetia bacterium]|nr:hypothetical protein [Spirochaetia bacterium]
MKVISTINVKEYEQLSNSLARIPLIDRLDYLHDKQGGFLALLISKVAKEIRLDVTVIKRAFLSIIIKVVTEIKNKNRTAD